jgi:CRISPR-associated endonuclease/helicase Cas3
MAAPATARGGSKGEIWLDGGFVTEPRPLREASYGIEVILRRDRDDVASGRRRPEEIRIPMPPPKDQNWMHWPDEIAFCKVPPDDRIEYDETRGARWRV